MSKRSISDNFKEYNALIVKHSLSVQKKHYWLITPEEAVQVGWEAFLIRLNNGGDLDPSKNIEALIAMRVRGGVFDYIRKQTSVREIKNGVCKTTILKTLPLEDAEKKFDGFTYELLNPFAEKYFEKLLAKVKSPEKIAVMRYRYKYELGVKEISSLLNVSESMVSKIINSGLKELQKIKDLNLLSI